MRNNFSELKLQPPKPGMAGVARCGNRHIIEFNWYYIFKPLITGQEKHFLHLMQKPNEKLEGFKHLLSDINFQ